MSISSIKTIVRPLVTSIAVAMASPAVAVEEFDELKVLVEINATDGDVGFHALADADAWRWFRLDDPDGNPIFSNRAMHALRTQGLTENFFESSEPLCAPDEEEPDEIVVTLEEFLSRFAAGIYTFRANNNEGDRVLGEAVLTYDLPAAPNIEATEDMTFAADAVTLIWEPGEDLGETCSDESLVDNGTIADPRDVAVVYWEVVVEAETEDGELPELVYSTQLPAESTSVTVPQAFLQPFLDVGVEEFKVEIGAVEESGNQTFSEGEFSVEL